MTLRSERAANKSLEFRTNLAYINLISSHWHHIVEKCFCFITVRSSEIVYERLTPFFVVQSSVYLGRGPARTLNSPYKMEVLY